MCVRRVEPPLRQLEHHRFESLRRGTPWTVGLVVRWPATPLFAASPELPCTISQSLQLCTTLSTAVTCVFTACQLPYTAGSGADSSHFVSPLLFRGSIHGPPFVRTSPLRVNKLPGEHDRVLGGGLGNRLVTRLQPMVIFMGTHDFAGECPAAGMPLDWLKHVRTTSVHHAIETPLGLLGRLCVGGAVSVFRRQARGDQIHRERASAAPQVVPFAPSTAAHRGLSFTPVGGTIRSFPILAPPARRATQRRFPPLDSFVLNVCPPPRVPSFEMGVKGRCYCTSEHESVVESGYSMVIFVCLFATCLLFWCSNNCC